MLNYALYQAGWLAAVVGAGQEHPWGGMAVALALMGVHTALARERAAEVRLMLMAGVIGLLVDSTHVRLGLLSFPTGMVVPGLCPPWIVVMWMQFATTIRFSLHWLLGPLMRGAVFGAVGGPLAYLVGHRLGAVVWGPSPALTVVGLSVLWTLAVPVLVLAARREISTGYRIHASGEPGRSR
jgi:hypothetical protein